MKFFDNRNKLESILSILNKVSGNLGLSQFVSIFDYGDENSGELLYNRYQNEHKNNLVSFYLSLCEIDRMKLYKHIRFYENCA
jgi:hypothetical protein